MPSQVFQDLNIVVLMKQVPKSNTLQYDAARNEIWFSDEAMNMNYDDANNLEAALQLKERCEAEGGHCRITAVTLGTPQARSVLREAMAVGADQACLIQTARREDTSGERAAHILSQALRKLGSSDLILTGYQSQDDRSGMVGAMVAEYLGIPHVSHVERFDVRQGGVSVQKSLGEKLELIEISTPCLLSNLPQPYRLRGATYMGITEAMGKEVVVYEAEELAGSLDSSAPVVLYSTPQQKGRKRLVTKDAETGEVMRGIIDQLVLHHHTKK